MAAFGKVHDLLDERYLRPLQDVYGNVEPMPTLVPYEDYTQTVLVYRMDTNHELFMGLIQDFTARSARDTGKELWTWCTQWEVGTEEESSRLNVPATPPTGYGPSPKRPRLDLEQPPTQPEPQQQTVRRPPIIDVFERRILDPELIHEEDMMRILIDIVQADSSLVPNFIEFLYRWIDFYEGDGKALKAALKWEIPSLWEFEYHPLTLPGDLSSNAPASRAEELAQSSPTKKMREKPEREKPDLAALERDVDESERLQYREVKYGIQPPKMKKTLPPLINIPQDQFKRARYYAACFKSRQRAVALLIEAGITIQQVGNYTKLQEAHPKDTPGDGDPNELRGLQNYNKDAAAAQEHFKLKEAQQLQREKQREIGISQKLSIEARFAAANGGSDGSSRVPPISHPQSSQSAATGARPTMADTMMEKLAKLKAKKEDSEDRTNLVPSPLMGKMKGKFFVGAVDEKTLFGQRFSFGKKAPVFAAPRWPAAPGAPQAPRASVSPSQDGSDSGSDVNDENEPPLGNAASRFYLSAAPPLLHAGRPQPSLPDPSQQVRPLEATPLPPGVPGLEHPSQPTDYAGLVGYGPSRPHHGVNIFEYMHSLTANQLQGSTIPQMPTAGSGAAQPGNAFLSPGPRPLPATVTPARASIPWPPIQQPVSQQAPTLSAPMSVEQFLAMQRARETPPQAQPEAPSAFYTANSFSGPISQPPRPQPVPQSMLPTPELAQNQMPTPRSSMLPPNPPSLQRNAPSPLNLTSTPVTPSPWSSFGPSLLATSPFDASPHGIPIQIYYPKILIPGNGIGPEGLKLGTSHTIETDALLIGHTRPCSGKITLSKAIFLPVGVWSNTLTRVQKGAYTVLESYPPTPAHPKRKGTGPMYAKPGSADSHKRAYVKIVQAFDIMKCEDRETDLTKRWRTSPGMMTQRDRGAVWEGYAGTIDDEIWMSAEERTGAMLHNGIIDDGVEQTGTKDPELMERRRLVQEMLEYGENESSENESNENESSENESSEEDEE